MINTLFFILFYLYFHSLFPFSYYSPELRSLLVFTRVVFNLFFVCLIYQGLVIFLDRYTLPHGQITCDK